MHPNASDFTLLREAASHFRERVVEQMVAGELPEDTVSRIELTAIACEKAAMTLDEIRVLRESDSSLRLRLHSAEVLLREAQRLLGDRIGAPVSHGCAARIGEFLERPKSCGPDECRRGRNDDPSLTVAERNRGGIHGGLSFPS